MSQNKLDIAPGVLTGDQVQEVLDFAKANQFALPAVNVTSSSTVNAAMEAAVEVSSPIFIQLSNGGSDTHCGCAEQYGRAPGFARYCWW